jgi:hypothetical protein
MDRNSVAKFVDTVHYYECECDLKVRDSLIKGGYIGGGRVCAILDLSPSPEEYLNPKGRKHRYWMRKKWKDAGLKYTFKEFYPIHHFKDMFNINTSLPERCGREMTDAYKRSPVELKAVFGGKKPPECQFHWSKWFGAFRNGTLVAYILLRRIGELTMYSMLLGHGDHLKGGVMFGLHYHVYSWLFYYRGIVNYILYGDWRDGTEGMQFWKKRCRFKPEVLMEVA